MSAFKLVKLIGQGLNNTIITGGLVPKGAYDNGVDYAVGDSVDYQGSSYVMHTNAAAGVLPTDTTKWQVLANKGNTGATGATGDTGAQGPAGDDGEDGVGVPSGGSANQALTKVNATDYNTQWSTINKSFVGLGNVDNTSDAGKPISTATQTALDAKVDENSAITGATKTKITYDAKGLVTAGADATTADIADSSNKRYVTDAQLTVIGNTSGTNTGDQTLASLGVTSSAAELNILDGATLTTTELNYVDGVTSAIQTQLDAKAADADVVHDTGSETIGGVKTFTSDPIIPDEAYDATAWNGSLEPPTKNAVRDKFESIPALTDGDKGDITLSSSGTVWTIDNDVVTYAKMQNVSATDKILGRVSASAGDVEEITFTDQAQQLADDTSFSDMRTTLGLGTIATQAANNVSITGGSITGITDLAVADGGTGASTAADARTNLGLVAGGSGDIWVEKAGDTITGELIVQQATNINTLAVGGANPDATSGSMISFETDWDKKLVFWGDSDEGYTRLDFRPERRTGNDASDVQLVVHKLLHSTMTEHKHFSLYTSNAAGTPTKRFNWDYGADIVDFDIEGTRVDINDSGALGSGQYLTRIYSNIAQTDANSRILYVKQDNASATAPVAEIANDGTGIGFRITQSGIQTAAFIDQNTAAKALFIDHDDTGTSASVDIDRDGNNAGEVKGLTIDVANAGAGSATAINVTAGTSKFQEATFAADITVPDEAYGAGWNGSLEVPTKNAVYDKIETISAGSGISEALALAYAAAL